MDVYLVNSDGTNPVRLTSNAAQDENARWSPDGSQLVFMRAIDGMFKIFRINSDGTGEVQLANTAANETSPSWAP